VHGSGLAPLQPSQTGLQIFNIGFVHDLPSMLLERRFIDGLAGGVDRLLYRVEDLLLANGAPTSLSGGAVLRRVGVLAGLRSG
jgi:hypothetical protein